MSRIGARLGHGWPQPTSWSGREDQLLVDPGMIANGPAVLARLTGSSLERGGSRLVAAAGAASPRDPALVGGPAVSVVIPARNEALGISRCLESIRRALNWVGVAALEVVVVDDASVDDTAAVAGACGATVLRQDSRQGPTAAWMRGVQATTAPVVVFVDADCEVSGRALAALLEVFVRPNVGVAAGRSVAVGCVGGGGLVERSAKFSGLFLHEIKSQLTNHDFLSIGRLMAVRRSAWHVSDGSLAPCDRVVANVAKLAGWEVTYVPDAEVYYQVVTSFRELREDYLRTNVARVHLPLGRDALPVRVLLHAALVGTVHSPVNALAWATCRCLLLTERALGLSRRASGHRRR